MLDKELQNKLTKFTVDEIKHNEKELRVALEYAGFNHIKGQQVRCAFCGDSNPSGWIKSKDGIYVYECFKCGFYGSVIDVYAKAAGEDPSEIIKACKADSHKPKQHRKRTDNSSDGRKNNKTTKDKKIFHDVDEIRKLFNSTIGPIVAEYPYYDKNGEDVLGYVVRLTDQKNRKDGKKTYRPIQKCNGGWVIAGFDEPKPLYNLPGISANHKPKIVCEGEKAAQALNDLDFCATTSPQGARTVEKADWTVLTDDMIYVWPDNDQEGRKYAGAVIEKCMNNGNEVFRIDPASVDLDGDGDDAFDLIHEAKLVNLDPKNEVDKALKRAKQIRISDSVGEMIENIISGKREAIETANPYLDDLTQAFLPGTATILCSEGGTGKTFLQLQWLSYWILNRIKAAVYMLEDSRTYHLLRCLTQGAEESGIFKAKWIKENPEQARRFFEENRDFLDSVAPHITASPTNQPDLNEIVDWIEQKAKSGYRIVCADPITAAVQTDQPWVADSRFLSKVKKISIDYNISVMFVTHPKKGYGAPGLDDLAGGASTVSVK